MRRERFVTFHAPKNFVEKEAINGNIGVVQEKNCSHIEQNCT